MNENEEKTEKPAVEGDSPRSGFFRRIFTKLDESMKEKADAKVQNSCCDGDDGKGGKCC